MDTLSLMRVISHYRRQLILWDILENEHPDADRVHCPKAAYEHCLYMLSKATQLMGDNQLDEAIEMAGFVRGILWAEGVFTLEELHNHMYPKNI